MHKIVFVSALLLFSLAGMSQDTDTAVAKSDPALAKTEFSASFPGGAPAWQLFLNKNLRFPEELLNKIRGRKARQWEVMIMFMVTKDGKIRNIEAVTNHGNGLEDEAIRVLRKSPDWVPAQQNGKNVNSMVRQPFIFRVER